MPMLRPSSTSVVVRVARAAATTTTGTTTTTAKSASSSSSSSPCSSNGKAFSTSSSSPSASPLSSSIGFPLSLSASASPALSSSLTLTAPATLTTTTAKTAAMRRALSMTASRGSGHGPPQYDPPTGWLFGIKPGEKYQREGWEGSMAVYWISTILFAIALAFKPDTTIQTWALEEARRRLEKEGILEDPFPEKPAAKSDGERK